MAIREALTRADPAKRSFRSNQEICVSADHLIRSIVECIEDMILLTSKEKTSWRQKLATAPRFRHRTPPPDPDMILGKLEEALEEFERVIDQDSESRLKGCGEIRYTRKSRQLIKDDQLLYILTGLADFRQLRTSRPKTNAPTTEQ
ncbi:hypothetical protein KXX40_000334 [Aspergillus fumigatus]|nr:hypothetical protein KXX40_000334 [Aspergillus fumigatus]